ncbi:CpsD/CapB family tyrosine-protein kinase [Geomicrobium sp. JSM 1781026]|uniref:CpsD/CapB family tyrosine-protein kinase n=1 Tax=Geomicrobium sp. JSM 1781026 TaxID=3344580 RepID=UPI0035C1D6C3
MLKRKSPKKANRRRSIITRDQPRSPISEQFRTIRTNIQYAAVDDVMQVVMGTSAGPGDGKTTVNTNLAVTMSQQGGRVLLIDADMRKPTMHYSFGVPNHRGLSSVITHQSSLSQAIQPTNVDDLDVLTCGPIPPNPSELLSSKTMTMMMTEARSLYDYIVIDTPPVIAVTDAQIIAGLSDGAMLIVSSGETEIDDGKKAVERLAQSGVKMLGAVLNRQARTGKQYAYYYGS